MTGSAEEDIITFLQKLLVLSVIEQLHICELGAYQSGTIVQEPTTKMYTQKARKDHCLHWCNVLYGSQIPQIWLKGGLYLA